MELYYEKPFVKISWDEELGCIFVQWIGFSYGEDFRNGMNKVIELARKKSATKTLADLRKMRVTSQEDQEWLIQEWTPRAEAVGLRYTATLVPESALAKSGYDKSIPQMATKIETAPFGSLQEAKQWLRHK